MYIDENFPKPTWEYNMIGFPGGERYLIITQSYLIFQQNSYQFKIYGQRTCN